MSLHAAAQHLSSKGRGPDNTLVHMSRDEVKSLNDLAMAHGGHLTINPETGLPEAGFLDKLLPAIIGGGLAIATGGAALPILGGISAPTAIGLGVGGIEALRTGDIKKGLMAGLGAYGGAGLAGGLMGAGNAAIGEAASAANPSFVGPMPGAASGMEAAKAGISSLGTEAGRASALGHVGGGMGLASLGLAAANPFLQEEKAAETPTDNTPAKPLQYNIGAAPKMPRPDVPEYGDLGRDFGRQQSYFPDAGYKPSTYEERGFAGGGPIEAMSTANAIGANTGYPMADISKGAYATPYQTPISRNVLSDTADTGVNPITGEMAFADGGITGQGNLNLQIPLDIGGGGQFGQNSANGYRAAGSGGGAGDFGGGFNSNNSSAFTGLGGINGIMGPAVQRTSQFAQTNNQGFGGLLQGLAGLIGGVARQPSASQTYEQYLAGRNPMQQDVQLTREQFEANRTGRGASMVSPASFFKGGGSVALYRDGGLSDAAYNLGGYSDGGRLLRGPGDGVSDSIPAVIGKKQPARLADGEFVVPARIVSELGNGSTEAGARKLYAMMDRIQKARGQTVGKGKVAKNSRAEKYLPA